VDAFAARIGDPATRSRIVAEMRVIFLQQTGAGPQSVQFRELAGYPEMQGQTLADLLTIRGRPVTVDAGIEALIELQLEGGFIGIFHGMSEDDVIRIMQHPTAMFETDGDLVEPGTGFPHPRSYGSFPRILSKYVRDQGVLTLEQAVRKMSAQPAAWLHETERGTLAPGMMADVVIFDADQIQDRAEYTDPHHYSDGVVHVIVNGVPVLEAGELSGARPGRFLERGRVGPSAAAGGR